MPIIRHSPRAAKVLHSFPLLQSSSEDNNRVVFLSERDFNIILNCLELTDQLRNRVFYSSTGDLYEVVSDEDWVIFQGWVQKLYFNLGEWIVSNEMLERIAVALESLDDKAGTLVTWEEFIEDIEGVLGVGNAFVETLKLIRSFIPNLDIKVNPTPIIQSIIEYFTWRAPILAILTSMSAALAASAAAAVAEKPLLILRTIFDGFNSVLNLNNRIYEFILGDWNWWDDVIKPLWDAFISDGEGGTGGPDPDNDPDGRVSVNLNQQLAVNVVMDAFCCAVENVQVDEDNQTVYPEDSTWDGLPITTPTNPDFIWDGGGGDTMKCKHAFYIVDWFRDFYGSGMWSDVPGPGDPFGLVEWLNTLIRTVQPIGLPRQIVTRLIGWLIGQQPNEAALTASTISGFVDSNFDELVCTLYTATNQDDAIEKFLFYFYSNYTGATVDIWLVELVLRANNTLALLWFDPSLPVSIPAGYTCDCEDPCANFEILPFPAGEINAGLPMGDLSDGTLGFDTSGFTLESRPGGYAFVTGEYVRFQTPDVQTCYELSITLSGWTPQASGLSAQISGICGGGTQNFEYSDQASLNAALADICIGPCGYIVIRGGSAPMFTAEVTVTGYSCL